MKINTTGLEHLRTDRSNVSQRGTENGAAKAAAQPTTPVARPDSVQISDAGRALAAQAASATQASSVRGELSAERISEIRQKILDGAYNSLDVVDEVARRMLASGDI
jgi:negative regulator of flagellin synthesis FlgM